MAENLRRGLARHYLSKRWEDVEALGPNLHVKGSGLDSDVLYYFDSDSHYIYSAERIEYNIDSDGGWNRHKLVYKSFNDGWTVTDADLLSAVDAKTHFIDKQEVYDQGPFFKINTEYFFVDDSEQLFWRKIVEPGTQKSHYATINYNFPKTRINSAESAYGWSNKTNVSSFSLFDPFGTVLSVNGENIITNNTGRLFKHGDFLNLKPASIWVRNADTDTNLALLEIGSLTSASLSNKTSDRYKCYGQYYSQAVNDDASSLTIRTSELDPAVNYVFHYATELADSETPVTFSVAGAVVEFPEVLTASDANVVSSFGTWDGDEAPWKVFNDSDNSGFKATLGTETGSIGYIVDLASSPYQYTLQNVVIRNTPATVDQNRPYDFRIEGRTRENVWETIETVQGFEGYVYDKSFDSDSDYSYYGFRVSFTNCQPDFDPAVNSLEVKTIRFTAGRITPNFFRKDRGYWLTTSGGTTTFKTGGVDVTLEGALLGGGGGGGCANYPWGGGGGGGCYVQINNLVLPANKEFQIYVGDGGASNTTGEATYIRNVTDNQNIIVAGGGQTASNPNVDTNPSTGGAGGVATIDNVNYTVDATVFVGGRGGTTDSRTDTDPEDGFPGHNITLKSYASDTTYTLTGNVNVGAGGGAGSSIYTPGSQGGLSAGQGAGRFAANTAGVDERGGGGGGAGTRAIPGRPQENFAGKPGGSGFAYIIFK